MKTGNLPAGMEEMFHSFARRVKELSAAERRILNYYISGHEIAEIPELAFISIHTVKKHNRSIYQKLDISSRDELMLYFRGRFADDRTLSPDPWGSGRHGDLCHRRRCGLFENRKNCGEKSCGDGNSEPGHESGEL